MLRSYKTEKHESSSFRKSIRILDLCDTTTVSLSVKVLSLHASFWNYFYISEQYRLIVQKTRESFIFLDNLPQKLYEKFF